MTREQVLTVLPKIVDGLKSEATQAKLDASEGDLGVILQTIMEVQGTVLMEAGIDPLEGLQALGKLGETYADDAEIQALLASLKAQTDAARG